MKKTTITYGPSRYLRGELNCAASVELAEVLENWQSLTVAQAIHLRNYLTDELSGYGILAADRYLDGIENMGKIRAEAKRVIARIDSQLQELDEYRFCVKCSAEPGTYASRDNLALPGFDECGCRRHRISDPCLCGAPVLPGRDDCGAHGW